MSYFIHLVKDSCFQGKFASNQWGALPDLLRTLGKSQNWLHLFQFSNDIPNVQTGKDWLERFNQESQQQETHAMLENFLSMILLFRVLKDWATILWQQSWIVRVQEEEISKLSAGWLWPLLKVDWEDSMIGRTAIQNILFIKLFEKALSVIPRQPLGLYLLENQAWERAFLHTWRKYGHGKIIGVAHSTIRYWDFRYYDESLTKVLPELSQPDLIAVNGPHAWKMLAQSGNSMERCVPVEALRYQYLLKLPQRDKFSNKVTKKRSLLILLDYQQITTHKMMQMLELASPELREDYKILIKPHPANPMVLSDYPRLRAEITYQSFIVILPKVDVALASVFTSASVDAFCSGVPVIEYLDESYFNFSSLRGHSSLKYISSAEELIKTLKGLQNWYAGSDKSEDYFWIDEDLTMWCNLLKTTLTSTNTPQNISCCDHQS